MSQVGHSRPSFAIFRSQKGSRKHSRAHCPLFGFLPQMTTSTHTMGPTKGGATSQVRGLFRGKYPHTEDDRVSKGVSWARSPYRLYNMPKIVYKQKWLLCLLLCYFVLFTLNILLPSRHVWIHTHKNPRYILPICMEALWEKQRGCCLLLVQNLQPHHEYHKYIELITWRVGHYEDSAVFGDRSLWLI